MKVVVAGSREIYDYQSVVTAIELSGFQITEVVSGTARGPDRLGEQWARENHIKITRFPADWKSLGPAAGPIRNKQMAEYADAAVVVWDGSSSGSKNMIACMNQLSKPCFVHIVDQINIDDFLE